MSIIIGIRTFTLPEYFKKFRPKLLFLFVFLFLCGCAEISETVKSMERDLALKKIKKGEINGSTYENRYYNCLVVGPSDWSTRLGYPKFLVEYTGPDDVTTIWLKVLQHSGPRQRNSNYAISAYLSDKKTYQKIDESLITVSGQPCKVYTFLNRWKDRPEDELMKTIIAIYSVSSSDYIMEGTTLAPLFSQYQGTFSEFFKSLILSDFSVFKHDDRIKSQDEGPAKKIAQQPSRKRPITKTDGRDFKYTTKPGDTLGKIAAAYTGNPSNWWKIAEYNHIVDPAAIKPGREILIPHYLLAKREVSVSGSKSNDTASTKEQYVSETEKAESNKTHIPEISSDNGNNRSKRQTLASILPGGNGSSSDEGQGVVKASHKRIKVVRSSFDPIDRKKVNVMSGPGPAPIYKVVGQVPVGKKLDFVSKKNNYVIIKYEGKDAYLFIKNVEFLD